MTKVRTIIPSNAKPGRSIIQVVNPHTGIATRVRVPPHVIPGQVIELDLNNEASINHTSQSAAQSLVFPPLLTTTSDSLTETPHPGIPLPEPAPDPLPPAAKEESDGTNTIVQPIARIPTPTSIPMPTEFSQPHSYYIGDGAHDEAPLLGVDGKSLSAKTGWFYTCVRFFHCPC